MKKFTQAADDSGIPLKLIRNVARQIGDKDRLEDVARHGADAGYPGFTYYSDTGAAKAEYLPSVYRCLGGGRLTDEDDIVANALAWFAAEEVARALFDV